MQNYYKINNKDLSVHLFLHEMGILFIHSALSFNCAWVYNAIITNKQGSRIFFIWAYLKNMSKILAKFIPTHKSCS